jgi:hypothetical protein
VILELVWAVGSGPTWLGYGLGGSLIVGTLCAVSWLHGNDRIGRGR